MIAPTSRKLGKYEIRYKLGRGGMADVYLALDTEFGTDVALKLIEDSPDADTRDSIKAEQLDLPPDMDMKVIREHNFFVPPQTGGRK